MKEKLVTLATDNYSTAEVLKAKLEAEGIECYLKNVNLLQAITPFGVKIQVPSSKVEKALRLMAVWKADHHLLEKKQPQDIRRILVPVDFSENSKNACLFALELAAKFKADIKLLHVYIAPVVDLVPITDIYNVQVDVDINLRKAEKNAHDSLKQFVNEFRQIAKEKGLEKIKIGYTLQEGFTEDQIALVAYEYNAGIIVVGSKGKSNNEADIIGSVVEGVFDKTNIPVLAIPEKATFSKKTSVGNVMYATRFDESDYLAIRRLASVISGFEAKIYCVHISQDPENPWNEAKIKALTQYFRKVSTGVEVKCGIIKGDDPVESIEKFTKENNIDLVAIVNRKRGLVSRFFNKGIARQLFHHVNIPLLVFRG